MQFLRGWLSVFGTAVLVVACGEDVPTEPGLASITVDTARVQMALFDTRVLSATVRATDGRVLERPPVWRSGNDAIVMVSSVGGITATGVGQTYVFAELEGLRDSARVTVTWPPVHRVTAPDSIVIGTGYTTQLDLRAFDARGFELPGYPFQWDHGSNVTVTPQGMLTATSVTATRTHVQFRTLGGPWTALTVRIEPTIRELARSIFHSCLLREDGRAYCWGQNQYGQLGTGASPGSAASTPQAVAGGHRFTSIDVGEYHACGVTIDRDVYCWGRNTFHLLGTADPACPAGHGFCNLPVLVAGGHKWKSLTLGEEHTCGLTEAATVYCWGRNNFGQLGLGPTDGSYVSTPAAVATQARFIDLQSGSWTFTCAVATDGRAHCWGAAAFVPEDPTKCSGGRCDAPVPIASDLRFTRLSGGWRHTCGTTDAGQVHCWGYFGSEPIPVGFRAAYLQEDYGIFRERSCGLDDAGRGYCWSWNSAGPSAPVALPITGDLELRWIAASYQRVCAVTKLGVGYCWSGDPAHEDPQLVPKLPD